MTIQLGRLDDVIQNMLALKDAKIELQIWKEKEVQQVILNLNRIEQLFKKGIDSEGDVIGVYSVTTELLSEGESFSFKGNTKRKRAGDPIILFDGGDFYASFKIIVDNDGFTIEANEITDDGTSLTQRFGDDILGLTENSINELVEIITPFIIEAIRAQILK